MFRNEDAPQWGCTAIEVVPQAFVVTGFFANCKPKTETTLLGE